MIELIFRSDHFGSFGVAEYIGSELFLKWEVYALNYHSLILENL